MNLDDVRAARERIKPYLDTTPLIRSWLLERALGKSVWLKLETQNPTGSFKARPAFNGMLTHLKQARERGVIASSSGNFAQGVAYAASKLGVNAMIVMTESTSPYKVERTKALGAEVVISDDSHEARLRLTEELHRDTGRLMLHPYDSEETILGDATIGLELSEQMGGAFDGNTTVLVPVSGGGLLAGISFALKSLHPSCKIIGVQSKEHGSLAKSLEAGSAVKVAKFKSVADALTASKLGDKPFQVLIKYVDGAISVDEKNIINATQYMLEQHKLVVEPAAAISIAALFGGLIAEDKVICILTGGNIQATFKVHNKNQLQVAWF